jgi:hypothetical protein
VSPTPPPLEERFAELRRTGDLELRSAIIRDYGWLAEHCAGRFRRRGEPHDDLVQVTSGWSRRSTAKTRTLEADLEEAQQTSVTPPTASGGTAATTLDPTPDVLRQSGGTPVTIAWGSGIDLDTDAANWGVDAQSYDVFILSSPSIAWAAYVLVSEPPIPATCAASTLLVTRLSSAETVVGQQFCVHTNEERWAYMRIAAIDTEARTISFDVTVWKLPTDP